MAQFLKIYKAEKAFNGYLNTYKMKGEEKIGPKVFLQRRRFKIVSFLQKEEKMKKGRMSLEIQFRKGLEMQNFYAYSSLEIISEVSNIKELYDTWMEEILKKIEEYESSGSGWIFKKVVELNIHLDKYSPISGSSYLPLPKILAHKKAIVNPKNKDNECFKWAITAALYTPESHPERITKKLKADSEKLEWGGLEFPVSLKNIIIFEKNNPTIAINVYGYEKELYPLRIAKGAVVKTFVNLLLLTDAETNHYCWIRRMSALLYKQISQHKEKKYICHRCLNCFSLPTALEKHQEYCSKKDALLMRLPKEGEKVQFKNYHHSMRVPFVIYADFECFTEKMPSCQPSEEKSFTQKYQHHTPSGFFYVVKSENKPMRQFYFTKTKEEQDVAAIFVKSIEKTVKEIYKKIVRKKARPTAKEKKKYKEATDCHICNLPLNGDKVFDHNHLTGKFRGAAHNSCNLNYKIPKHIPVIFHNLSGYDAHLFIKNLGVSSGKINCIPNTEEKYISFTKEIIVDEFTNKSGKNCKVKREIRFIDSFKFMSQSLDKLANNLEEKDLKSLRMVFSKEVELLRRKGVFPYDYFDSFEKLSETQLPPQEEFYSKLNDSNISDNDYEHAKQVWKKFNMVTFRDYHNLYMHTDVLLLTDVFEKFRDVCLQYYKLDPCWYYTAPGLAWDAMLKKTNVKLELLSDVDMLLMVEKGIRGGISIVPKRYAKANNKYMQNYNPSEENVFIKYLDANNLYGWAMSQKMPHSNFTWMKEEELENWQDFSCFLEVDLDYPTELHNLHNEYPLAPERLVLHKVEKLVPNLWNKEKYVLHYSALKVYVSLGLKIKKIHRGIKFSDSKWLADYIDMNTQLRTVAKNDFEKDFFKLMNNSVFGKTMENIRNRQDIKLCNTEAQVKKLVSRPNYKKRVIFTESLAAVHMNKTELKFNKPIYVGMSILDVSKTLMYDFHYNYLKKKYGEKANLLLSDTDSLMYEIRTEDFYQDIYADLEEKFDTSAYNNHPVIDKKLNKKVIGRMKDETSGVEILEFVGLRPKLYSFTTTEEVKKAKGVKKMVIKKELTFQDYKECLFHGISQSRKMNVIRSYQHEIYTETVNKIALSNKDDKFQVLKNGIETLAHGYST